MKQKRKRDFFRLNKKDRSDLQEILQYDVTIPAALKHASPAVESFFRLKNKFYTRLLADKFPGYRRFVPHG